MKENIRSFAVANVAVALSMVGAFTSWVLWPIFLKNVWHYSVWQVGLAFTVSPLVSGAMAISGLRPLSTASTAPPATSTVRVRVESLGSPAIVFEGLGVVDARRVLALGLRAIDDAPRAPAIMAQRATAAP